MKTYKIKLNDIFPNIIDGKYEASLECYVADNFAEIDENALHAAVLICPGGGYHMVSAREAEPVALKFLGEGYNAYVLRYSAAADNDIPARFPTQALQAFMAIAYIRQKAKEHHTDTGKVLCCGFSAGGHLAGTTGCFFDNEKYITSAFNPGVPLRPDGLILCYPVITSGEKAHRGSFLNLTGDENSPLYNVLSLENSVKKTTPPIFIWHTRDDMGVPVENSLLFADALKKHNVLHKLELYERGVHGLSLASKLTAPKGNPNYINADAAKWFSSALDFFETQVFK